MIVGAYKPVAEFIKLSRKTGFNPVFVNISFVGANALAKELGPDGKGVIVSQVVPFPWRHFAQGRRRLSGGDQGRPAGRAGFVSLEGYLVGRLAIAALDKAGADVDPRRPAQGDQGDRQIRHRRPADDVLGARRTKASTRCS